MSIEFRLPDIGEGIHEGEIVQWLIKQGDSVQEDQAIVEVMTDKVTAEIPSPVSGVVKELRGKAGETIKVGSVIVVFEPVGSLAPDKTPAMDNNNRQDTQINQAPEKPVANPEDPRAIEFTTGPSTYQQQQQKILAAPATRKLARTLGLDLAELSHINGSGPKGRITQSDLHQAHAASGGVAAPPKKEQQATAAVSHHQQTQKTQVSIKKPEASPLLQAPQGDRRVAFAGMRKKIAEHLVHSKRTIPHFAYVEEVDMSQLVAMRRSLKADAEAQSVKLTYLPFIIKAVIAGIKAHPVLNSQLDEASQELVYKGDVHMGVAVAATEGLIVPVIKHADQKSILQLATEIAALSEKARQNKLTLDEIKGGTFTLTSIGSIGGLFGVPIINHPEVAIMGVNKITPRPVVREGQIVIRDMMNLSLSGDHRVVDGAEAAEFTKIVVSHLENPARLLLV